MVKITALKQLKYYKNLAEKAISQLPTHALFIPPEEGSNSIAVIMKHMAGNMRSRWTSIFDEDGEKEWRKRDEEFIDDFAGERSLLLQKWEEGWDTMFNTLEKLTDDDLSRIIYIRNQGCSVEDAILRQLSHYAYHVGQIVLIAKMIIGEEFTSLSIPPGQSDIYNSLKFKDAKRLRHFTEEE